MAPRLTGMLALRVAVIAALLYGLAVTAPFAALAAHSALHPQHGEPGQAAYLQARDAAAAAALVPASAVMAWLAAVLALPGRAGAMEARLRGPGGRPSGWDLALASLAALAVLSALAAGLAAALCGGPGCSHALWASAPCAAAAHAAWLARRRRMARSRARPIGF